MKKVINIMVAFISLVLCSCESNECVKQIALIIEDGARRTQAFTTAVENGERTYSDIQEEDRFIRPDGNLFANPKVKAIIDKNSNYKLSYEDKEILTNAIDKFYPRPPFRCESTEADRIRDNILRADREYHISIINSANTLGDLLYPTTTRRLSLLITL